MFALSGQDQEIWVVSTGPSEKSASVRDLDVMRRLIREFRPATGFPSHGHFVG